MTKRTSLNVVLLLFSLGAALVVFLLGEVLLGFLSDLPFILQCAIYLTFVLLMLFAGIFLSEKVSTGYYIPRGRVTFNSTCAKAAAILIPLAFVLGLSTQLIYGFIFTETRGGIYGPPDGEVAEAIVDLIDQWDVSGDELDLVFVVDTSGSMGPHINDVRMNILHLHDTINSQTRNFRVALIDYRDFPERTWYAGDYPAMLQLDFTNDWAAVTEAINALTLGHGGDMPETLYYALSMSAELNWRTRAHRHVIVLADAPPLDPEPNTGYTLEQIARILEDADIELHLVGAGRDMSMITAFENMAERTGGTFTHVIPVTTFAAPMIVEQELETWWESPHLLLAFDGAGESSVLQIILHALLLSLWGIFIGIAVVIFLNNNNLFTSFFIPRAVVSVVVAVIFAILMAQRDIDISMMGRALLALGVCLLYLPTYSWGSSHAAPRY